MSGTGRFFFFNLVMCYGGSVLGYLGGVCAVCIVVYGVPSVHHGVLILINFH